VNFGRNEMKLLELQTILGERIRIASNSKLNVEERNKENETSDMIARLAKQMINNADIVLRSEKLLLESKIKDSVIESFIK